MDKVSNSIVLKAYDKACYLALNGLWNANGVQIQLWNAGNRFIKLWERGHN